LLGNARRSVACFEVAPCIGDLPLHCFSSCLTRAFGARLPTIIPSPRNTHHSTHQADTELLIVFPDQCVLHSFWFAKYAAAFFRKSISFFSSAFSFRSRLASELSSLE